MLKIHNFRVGHATNSSSSHSVILLPPSLIGSVDPIDEHRSGDDQFGWDYFRLVSEEAKLRYLAAQLFSRFDREENKAQRDLVAERMFREVPGLAQETDLVGQAKVLNYDGKDHVYVTRTHLSVDHQSVMGFGEVNDTMLDRLVAFFKSPRVVVLGGNDNSEDSHLNEVPGVEPLPALRKLMSDGTPIKVKFEGEYLIIYDPSDGSKARVSLGVDTPDYVKSITPELVDLKITDYCGRGCNFCYQSSTEAGQHGAMETILATLDMLREMEVFEVAIGGGEPTDHPQFSEIVLACVERGITPNFTTLSDKWLADDAVLKTVAQHVGGIGVSCTDKKALRLVEKIKEALNRPDVRRWPACTVSAQHVLGSVPISVTGEFLDAAFADRIPVLLLGFKTVGFGATYERYDDASTPVAIKLAIDAAKPHVFPRLSVDTALVDQYPDLLTALGVPDALVTSPEGKFSCYVDAVTKRLGPSSYVGEGEMEPLPMDVASFKAAYAAY